MFRPPTCASTTKAQAVKAQGELKTVMDSVMGRMGSTEAGAGGGEGGAG